MTETPPPDVPQETEAPDPELAANSFLQLVEDVAAHDTEIPDDLRERLDHAIETGGNVPVEEAIALLDEVEDRVNLDGEITDREAALLAALRRLLGAKGDES
jgi:hypothetical protein